MMSNKPSFFDKTADRGDYLVECYRSGHEELMFRVSHRDNWLKIQMLAQTTFLALAFGVEVAGVKATSSIPTALALALPTALTLTCLYVVEDRLIGLISRYLGRLSDLEASLTKSDAVIEYIGSSQEIREYANSVLPFRVLAQVVAFALVPTLLSTYRFANVPEWPWYTKVEIVLNAACFELILTLLHMSYKERKTSGRANVTTPSE